MYRIVVWDLNRYAGPYSSTSVNLYAAKDLQLYDSKVVGAESHIIVILSTL